MPPQSRNLCHVCHENESKYTCAKCRATVYCSVGCYKRHKESCGCTENPAVIPEERQAVPSSPSDVVGEEETLDDPKQLRSLTSLNWPYVPEESAYPDPLKRDDPRPVQLHQYEAIATSAAVRRAL
ncbi:hypothetical protein AZE42_13607, partial [Rhizopogon vesiculosus]